MSPNIKSVCVYCASSSNIAPHYKEEAVRLGQLLAERNWSLVFGAGGVGLMGVVASSVLEHGGEAIGIIPHHLRTKEDVQPGLTELYMVDTMHERKQMMVDRSDAFVILPGGFGTMDETFEILTWKLLGLHDKPVVLFNSNGYWDDFLNLIDKIIAEGFASPEHRQLFFVVDSVEQIPESLVKAPEERFDVDTNRM